MLLNLNNVSLRISAGFPSQFPRDPIPQIAFSGRSNVGKSSLINSLLGRKSLARVSGTPGKTITINFYEVDKRLFLVDLPGYGFAKRTESEKQKWSALTNGYFTENPDLDRLKLVIQLIDARIGPTQDDREMLGFLRQAALRHIVVATKNDKLNATERDRFIRTIETDEDMSGTDCIVLASSVTGEGKDDIWNCILTSAGLKS